jgi:hypothetical protein
MKFSELNIKSIEKLFRTIVQEYKIAEFLDKDSESIALSLIDHILDLKKGRVEYPEIRNRPETFKNNTGQINIANGNSIVNSVMNVGKINNQEISYNIIEKDDNDEKNN